MIIRFISLLIRFISLLIRFIYYSMIIHKIIYLYWFLFFLFKSIYKFNKIVIFAKSIVVIMLFRLVICILWFLFLNIKYNIFGIFSIKNLNVSFRCILLFSYIIFIWLSTYWIAWIWFIHIINIFLYHE